MSLRSRTPQPYCRIVSWDRLCCFAKTSPMHPFTHLDIQIMAPTPNDTDPFWMKLSELLEGRLSWWHVCHHLFAHLDRPDLREAMQFVRDQTTEFTGKREYVVKDWDAFLEQERCSAPFRGVLSLHRELYLQDQNMFSEREVLPAELLALMDRYGFEGLGINNAGFGPKSLRSLEAIQTPLPALRHLAVVSGGRFGSMEGIQYCPRLETLRLPSTRGMAHLDKLQKLTALRSLDMLSIEKLEPSGLDLRFPDLQVLHANEAILPLLHDDSVRGLTEVSLSVKDDQDLDLLGRVSAGGSIRSLFLIFPWHFSMEQLIRHGLHETLEELTVSPASVRLQGITRFKKLRKLKLSCQECLYPMPHLDEELKRLTELPKLEHLSLSIYGRTRSDLSGEWRTREAIEGHLGRDPAI